MDKYVFIDLTEPSTGLFEVRANEWWIVDKETGEQCFYVMRGELWPQCNSNKQIAEVFSRQGGYGRETELRQVPIVFVPRRYDS